jgi:hypothetical protein
MERSPSRVEDLPLDLLYAVLVTSCRPARGAHPESIVPEDLFRRGDGERAGEQARNNSTAFSTQCQNFTL